MPFKVPPSVNYQSPITFLPAVWNNDAPTEGAGYCPFLIDWGSMGGTNNSVSINLQNNVQTPNTMSQIVALTCDNSDCGADVIFVFPDTQETITIPAYESNVTVPVFSRSVLLYVTAVGAEPEDETRFLLHNVMPPPVAVPSSQEQQAASFNDITNDGASTTQLVPTTVAGTIQSLTVFFAGDTLSSAFSTMYQIKDGTGKLIAGGQVAGPNGGTVNVMSTDMQPVAIRFAQGLQFIQSGGVAPGGHFVVNIAYRIP